MVLALHFSPGVRWLLLVVVIAAAGYAVIRQLPESDVQAEPLGAVHPQQIRSVSLDGRDLPLAALRDVLASRVGDLIDLDVLARDRDALEAALVARGYLAARVADPHVTFGAGGGTFVTFSITQGQAFRIRNVNVIGASETDAGVVTLGGGEIADAARIALVRQALEARLAARGAKSSVIARLAPDANTGLVDIVLDAAPQAASLRGR